jgi:IS5 family transposase
MIRYVSQKQLPLEGFDTPPGMILDPTNRWVKLRDCIPWDELSESYYKTLCSNLGRPAKDARIVIGAVIIKHKLSVSDEETVEQIRENPYLQYFIGLKGFQAQAPFASSLLVEIRKRMGQTVFDEFHEAIIEIDGQRSHSKQVMMTTTAMMCQIAVIRAAMTRVLQWRQTNLWPMSFRAITAN